MPSETREKIVAARERHPDLAYKEIARMVGCSHYYVQQVCYEEQVGRGAPKVSRKDEFLKVLAEHPNWNTNRIATELGVNRSTAYRLRERYDPNFEGVVRLGRAALEAGLTVKKIEAMANGQL